MGISRCPGILPIGFGAFEHDTAADVGAGLECMFTSAGIDGSVSTSADAQSRTTLSAFDATSADASSRYRPGLASSVTLESSHRGRSPSIDSASSSRT